MRILLVDDDAVLIETLAENLIRQRYAVDIAENGAMAQEFLGLFSYDLLVLDMLLPDVDGITLCQQCRQQGTATPILMLTAEASNSDKVKALDAGADDYVVKPFDFDELCARIRALLRRDSPQVTTSLHWGRLQVNPTTFDVTYGEAILHTTPKEYALLELFLRHPSRVFSLDAIIENLWTYDDPPGNDAVRTHIKGLRQKLKAGGAPKDFIETVYGMGYRLKPLATEELELLDVPLTRRSPSHLPTPPIPTQVQQAKVSRAIAQSWSIHYSTMQERLQVLQSAAVALSQGNLPLKLRHDAQAQAHKLAGALGCFGFPDGSQLARKLEQMLAVIAPFKPHQIAELNQRVEQLRQALPQHPQPPTAAPNFPVTGNMVADSSLLHLLVIAADPMGPPPPDAGIRITMATHPLQAQALMLNQHGTFDGVLLEITAANYDDALTLLDTIAHCSSTQDGATQPTPVAVLIATGITDVQQQLVLVQRGGDRLLPPSPPWDHVIARLQEVLYLAKADFRIVLLDDDEQLLALLHRLLAPWGWQIIPVAHPTQLWTVLNLVQPHLLVLDVEMPGINGLDLCQILRADEHWRQLPIIFLTAHGDVSIRHQAFDVGADDFVNKANLATELPRRILNRLKRSPPPHFSGFP